MTLRRFLYTLVDASQFVHIPILKYSTLFTNSNSFLMHALAIIPFLQTQAELDGMDLDQIQVRYIFRFVLSFMLNFWDRDSSSRPASFWIFQQKWTRNVINLFSFDGPIVSCGTSNNIVIGEHALDIYTVFLELSRHECRTETSPATAANISVAADSCVAITRANSIESANARRIIVSSRSIIGEVIDICHSGIVMAGYNICSVTRGHRDRKKRPGVDLFFSANFAGLTNLCNQAHIQI